MAKALKIKGYTKENRSFLTKALRLFKNGKCLAVISWSVSRNGKKWCDNNRKAIGVGYLKSKELNFTARAWVLGKYKISLLLAND